MNAKCSKCGYEWETKSKNVYVSCPSCLRKMKIRECGFKVAKSLNTTTNTTTDKKIEVDTMNAKCSKCGYEWETESKNVYVSCPSCLRKVKIRECGFAPKACPS